MVLAVVVCKVVFTVGGFVVSFVANVVVGGVVDDDLVVEGVVVDGVVEFIEVSFRHVAVLIRNAIRATLMK